MRKLNLTEWELNKWWSDSKVIQRFIQSHDHKGSWNTEVVRRLFWKNPTSYENRRWYVHQCQKCSWSGHIQAFTDWQVFCCARVSQIGIPKASGICQSLSTLRIFTHLSSPGLPTSCQGIHFDTFPHFSTWMAITRDCKCISLCIRSVAEKLLNTSQNVPQIHLEDVYWTGLGMVHTDWTFMSADNFLNS